MACYNPKIMEHTPLTIHPKDVQRIIGKTERSGRNLLMAIRRKHGKERHQPVTVDEFCEYTGLPESKVLSRLTVSTEEGSKRRGRRYQRPPDLC